MIDRVEIHDATYTTLLNAHLESKHDFDALLLGKVRQINREEQKDSAENVETCETVVSIVAALCFPFSHTLYKSDNQVDEKAMLAALQMAPPECTQHADLVGWAPIRRDSAVGSLSTADTSRAKSMFRALSSIVSTEAKSTQDTNQESGASGTPFICLKVGYKTANTDALAAGAPCSAPTMQFDMVALELELSESDGDVQRKSPWEALKVERIPASVCSLRGFGVQEDYVSFQPHVAGNIPFLPQAMRDGLQHTAKYQADMMLRATKAGTSAVRDKAHHLIQQEVEITELEEILRQVEEQIEKSNKSPGRSAQSATSASGTREIVAEN